MELTVATLPALVLARAAERGEVTILRRKDHGIWKPVSWRALHERARSIGSGLRVEGVGRGACVGVLCDTRPEWVAIDIAVMGVGAVSAGLSIDDPPQRLATVLRECGCELVFAENEEQLDKVLFVQAECPALRRVVVLDMAGLRELDSTMVESLSAFTAKGADGGDRWDAGVAALNPDEPGALIYTGGTTGDAKPVLLTHRLLMEQAAAAVTALGLREGDERVAFLPMGHVLERAVGLYPSLVCGAVSNYVESPETILDNLREIQPTVIGAVPAAWRRWRAGMLLLAREASPLQRRAFEWALRAAAHRPNEPAGTLRRLADMLVLSRVRQRLGLSRARVAYAAMAPTPPDLLDWFRALGTPLRETYVITEAGGLVPLSLSGPATPRQPPRLSAEGELMIPGAQASTGYLGRPPILQEGWLPTGDVAVARDEGLAVLGRRPAVVSVNDSKPVEQIETALLASSFVADVLVLHEEGGLSGLVLVDHEAIERWAQERDLNFTSYVALIRSEPVREAMRREIAALNDRLPATRRLRGFRLIERRIQPGDPELTPVMRLRRTVAHDPSVASGDVVRLAA